MVLAQPVYANDVIYGWHLFLFIWSLWLAVLVQPLGRGEAGDWLAEVNPMGAVCLSTWPTSNKTLDTKAQVSFPGWQHLPMLSYFIAGRIKHYLYNSREQLELCAWFLLDPMHLFPLLILICILLL